MKRAFIAAGIVGLVAAAVILYLQNELLSDETVKGLEDPYDELEAF